MSAADIERLVDRASELAAESLRGRAQHQCQQLWSDFSEWCAVVRAQCLPASIKTVCCYYTYLSEEGYAPGSIEMADWAITYFHQRAGVPALDLPTKHNEVRRVLTGIRRTGAAKRSAEPIELPDLRKMVETLDGTLIGQRNRSLFLTAWGGKIKRSLVELNLADLSFVPDGLEIRPGKVARRGMCLRYGTDKKMCPVRALRVWLDASGIAEGDVFRSVKHGKVRGRFPERDFDRAVKAAAKAAGLVGRYSVLSLRNGALVSERKARM